MRRFVVVAALMGLFAGILGAFPAGAAGTVGSFEIDGNRPDSAAGEPVDWSDVGNVKSFTDPANSNKDDVYKDGSKALAPGGWACDTKKAPQKDDIVSAAIALRKVGNDRFMYVNWQRAFTNGTANVDYEFSQSNQEVCPGLPVRTEGDIILAYDFDNGGGTITIRAFRWHFTGPGVGVYVEDPNESKLVEHDTYDAAVNPGTGSSNEGSLPFGAFGEASIDLTRTIGDICPKFASAYVRTRTSTSISSDPKDRTQKRSDICPPPNLSLTKSATTASVEPGGNVQFNITATNNSTDGVANSAVISDTLPAGTTFVSCSDSCAVNGGVATWEAGPLGPGVSKTVSLVLRVDSVPSQCQLCNTATVDSPQEAGSPDATATGCVRVLSGVNPGTPSATGHAVGLHISDTGLGIDQTYTDVSSSTATANPDSHDASAASIALPAPPFPPNVLSVNVLRGVSTSEVNASPAESRDNTIAQVAGINILNGVVKADLVRAAAEAVATTDGATTNTNGTGFLNLYIDADGSGPGQPQLYDNASPGLVVDLSKLFGTDPKSHTKSGVWLRQVTQSTTGTFVADQTVTMIHVFAYDRDPITPGAQTTDIYVSQATAHAVHPSERGCPGTVSGHAFIASETTDPEIIPAIYGFVSIPAYGGHDQANLDQLLVPADGSVVSADLTQSVSDGTLTTSSASSHDYASLADLCVLRDALGAGTGCVVGATLVRSEATSNDTSSGGASSSDSGTQFAGLVVAGKAITVPVAANTVISLGPLGYVVLNEQFCDGGSPSAPGPVPTCSGSTHSGLTIRSIRVVLLPTATSQLAEVIVSEAHSDATAP